MIYLNGVQVLTGTKDIVPNVNRLVHNIGGGRTAGWLPDSYGGDGNVRMKYMKFYNKTLTTAQVQGLYSP